MTNLVRRLRLLFHRREELEENMNGDWDQLSFAVLLRFSFYVRRSFLQIIEHIGQTLDI